MSTTSTIELVAAPPSAAVKAAVIRDVDRRLSQSDDNRYANSTRPVTATGLTTITSRMSSVLPNPDADRKGVAASIITAITGVTIISSFLSGLVTIALPIMAKDLDIPDALLLWPASIYSLTCGCTLILSGAIADVVGPRKMYLMGTFLQSVFTLACGLSKTSTQFIIFRALAGIANSFCLPAAVSLITTYFPTGKRRNFAFGAMGGGQPLGFTVGLTAGGGLTDSVGWSVGFHMIAGVNFALLLLAFFALPKIANNSPITLARLKHRVDWIGAFILSASLALLLYVFATWTGSISNIRSAESLACLSTGVALVPAFVVWMNVREKQGKPVLIRNSIWRNKAFTSICINVFLTWGSFNATETFVTFLFQDVQGLSATSTSVRFLPEPITGTAANVVMGLFVHRLNAFWTLQSSFVVSALSPLLLAVMKTGASYWEFEFPAIALVPIATDVLYTISQLIITAEFDDNTQALAGGVFNTIAQVGKSVGLALSAIVASRVTAASDAASLSHESRLLLGYRGAWWFTFAASAVCIVVTFLGLRNVGKVGLKRE